MSPPFHHFGIHFASFIQSRPRRNECAIIIISIRTHFLLSHLLTLARARVLIPDALNFKLQFPRAHSLNASLFAKQKNNNRFTCLFTHTSICLKKSEWNRVKTKKKKWNSARCGINRHMARGLGAHRQHNRCRAYSKQTYSFHNCCLFGINKTKQTHFRVTHAILTLKSNNGDEPNEAARVLLLNIIFQLLTHTHINTVKFTRYAHLFGRRSILDSPLPALSRSVCVCVRVCVDAIQ